MKLQIGVIVAAEVLTMGIAFEMKEGFVVRMWKLYWNSKKEDEVSD